MLDKRKRSDRLSRDEYMRSGKSSFTGTTSTGLRKLYNTNTTGNLPDSLAVTITLYFEPRYAFKLVLKFKTTRLSIYENLPLIVRGFYALWHLLWRSQSWREEVKDSPEI